MGQGGMSEHVMIRDVERHALLCAVCKVRWPCQPKIHEVLAKIKTEAKKQ